ncbi:MAG: hypothetical protein VKL39_13060, partial [Leptolyngbyaceae bacterium]|nr:hypothetical protein [Leptolyngbyaceae bacterium]
WLPNPVLGSFLHQSQSRPYSTSRTFFASQAIKLSLVSGTVTFAEIVIDEVSAELKLILSLLSA